MNHKITNSIKSIFKDILSFKILSITLLLFSILKKASFIVLLYLISWLIISVQLKQSNQIILYIILIASFIALRIVSEFLGLLAKNRLSRNLENLISERIINIITLNNLYSWNKISEGEKIAFINQNVAQVVSLYHMNFFEIIGNLASVVLGFITIGLFLPIALAYVLPFVILLIIGQFLVYSQYGKIGQYTGQIMQNQSSSILTTFGNFLMIKRNNLSKNYKMFFKNDQNSIYNTEMKVTKIISLIIVINVGLSGFLSGLTILATILITAQSGNLILGSILGIITISFSLFSQSIGFIEILGSIMQGKSIYGQLNSMLIYKEFNQKEINDFKIITIQTKNSLSNEKEFVINKGEKILISGPNGSGKSSLLEFFSGNFWNENLLVKVNENEYENQSAFNLFQLSYLCTNQHYFENSTLKENLLFGKLLDKNYETESKQNLMNNLISKFNLSHLNLDEQITDQTITYSEGEKQRIQIIRAILSNKKILIFDESLTNIDEQNRNIIYDYLLNEEERTVLFVAHNFDNLKYKNLISKTLNTELFKIFENKEVQNA